MESIEDNTLSIIDLYVDRYNMNDSATIVYPGYNDIIVYGGCSGGSGVELPEGGGPGYYLTKNSYGDLVWKMLNNCLTWKKFITGPAVTNPVPYEFILDSAPENIFQVFVNGQLIDPASYDLEGYSVFVNAPTILDNATVTIFGACSSLNIKAAAEENQLFVWNEGDPYVFSTDFSIQSIHKVTVNGQEWAKGIDYTYTLGLSQFTILNPPNTLEDGDEIDITYYPSL